MQSYIVSIDVISKVLTLAEISKLIGQPDENGSYERGRLLKFPRLFRSKIAAWRMWSNIPEKRPLEDHLKALSKRIGPSFKNGRPQLYNKATIALNIGLLFDLDETVRGMIIMKNKELRPFLDIIDRVEVSAYPCSKHT